MNQHRQLQKAKLIDYQDALKNNREKALALCRMILPLIDPELHEVEEMDIPASSHAMDELVMRQAEILSLAAKIKRLEEALYR